MVQNENNHIKLSEEKITSHIKKTTKVVAVVGTIIAVAKPLIGLAVQVARVKNGLGFDEKTLAHLTDKELGEQREIIRLRHCNGDETAEAILHLFDKEIRKRVVIDPNIKHVRWTDANRWEKD